MELSSEPRLLVLHKTEIYGVTYRNIIWHGASDPIIVKSLQYDIVSTLIQRHFAWMELSMLFPPVALLRMDHSAASRIFDDKTLQIPHLACYFGHIPWFSQHQQVPLYQEICQFCPCYKH